MNIKDFLIDNYIWILVIILITIVTIIGYLADKNKGKKNEKVTKVMVTNGETEPIPVQNVNNQQINTPETTENEQLLQPNMNQMSNSMDNNISMNDSMFKTPMQTNNILSNNPQNMETIPQPINQIQNPIEQINNTPQPVENIIPNVEHESMYQPLSEQKPNIAPQPVQNFTSVPNNTIPNSNQMQPTMMSSILPQQVPTVNNQPEQVMNIQQQPVMNAYNMQAPTQLMGNNNSGVTTNLNNTNTTIPQLVQPVSTIPMPQPVVPQPIMTPQPVSENYNQQPTIQQPLSQQNIPMPQQSNNNTVVQSQPAQNSPTTPVGFVFGTQNNNPNM